MSLYREVALLRALFATLMLLECGGRWYCAMKMPRTMTSTRWDPVG